MFIEHTMNFKLEKCYIIAATLQLITALISPAHNFILYYSIKYIYNNLRNQFFLF